MFLHVFSLSLSLSLSLSFNIFIKHIDTPKKKRDRIVSFTVS